MLGAVMGGKGPARRRYSSYPLRIEFFGTQKHPPEPFSRFRGVFYQRLAGREAFVYGRKMARGKAGFSGAAGTGRSHSRLYTGRAAKREKSRDYFTSRRQKLSRAIHMKQKIYRSRMPTEKKKDMEWSTRPPPTPIMEEAVSVNSPEGDGK